MTHRFNQYIDQYQNLHFRDKVLGQGGQGVVFRTKDPDLAIKVVTDESGNPVTDKALLEKYSRRFKLFRILPLPEKLNISIPIALLQNEAGYVMQLLSEMVPFSHFWLDGKAAESIVTDDIPVWLSKMPEDEAKKIIHYFNTGGLRRRLTALSKCASLLARLHGNGFVYGDISHNNVFISEDIEYSEVWLIDADNIRFDIKTGGSIVYTPRYGAPELVQGKDAGRPASDCFAFAVLAFYLVSLIHPFIGKKVDGTDDCDWAEADDDDEDIEEKAYAGLFPWVDDQNDDSNSSDNGLPRSLLLTKELKSLFESTFGAGRSSPWLRPTIYHWPEALAQAADATVTCPSCSMSYYYDFINPETDDHNCPYCKTLRPQVLILESYRWDGADEPLNSPCWTYIREIAINQELVIPRRVLNVFTMTEFDEEELIISLSEKKILLKKTDRSNTNLSVALDNPQGIFQNIYSQFLIDRSCLETRFWIFANSNNPRVVLCSVSGGRK